MKNIYIVLGEVDNKDQVFSVFLKRIDAEGFVTYGEKGSGKNFRIIQSQLQTSFELPKEAYQV